MKRSSWLSICMLLGGQMLFFGWWILRGCPYPENESAWIWVVFTVASGVWAAMTSTLLD